MKILAINGSPRIGGNTDTLLDKVLEGAKIKGAEVEKIVLNELKFSPCQECENIKDDGSCIVQDDMQDVYEKIKKIDVLVFASPVFFGSLSAQAKMMIDRFQCVWRAKYRLKKLTGYKRIAGVFISVEGSDRKDFFENARSIVKNMFATINVDYKEELFCSGVDGKGAILKHPDYLKKAFDLGERLTKEGKMGNLFSASDVVEIGVQIEKNGKDFYDGVAKTAKSPKAKETFEFLRGEEERHIKRFEALLSQVKKYEPSEAYPGEYFAYLKALSEGYVFTKKDKGAQLAKNIKDEKQAVEAGVGFEKDSILFYHEMKKFVLGGEQRIVDKLIEEEKEHLRKLTEIKKAL